MSRVYLVRHCETEANTSGVVLGQIDAPLSLIGLNDTMRVAEKLSEVVFDEILSSTLQRAYRTTEAIAAKHNLDVKATPWSQERFVAGIQGINKEERDLLLADAMRELEQLSDDQKLDYRLIENAETPKECSKRMTQGLAALVQKNIDGTLLLVTHSGIIGNYLTSHGLMSFNGLFGSVKLPNGGYIVLEVNSEGEPTEAIDISQIEPARDASL